MQNVPVLLLISMCVFFFELVPVFAWHLHHTHWRLYGWHEHFRLLWRYVRVGKTGVCEAISKDKHFKTLQWPLRVPNVLWFFSQLHSTPLTTIFRKSDFIVLKHQRYSFEPIFMKHLLQALVLSSITYHSPLILFPFVLFDAVKQTAGDEDNRHEKDDSWADNGCQQSNPETKVLKRRQSCRKKRRRLMTDL